MIHKLKYGNGYLKVKMPNGNLKGIITCREYESELSELSLIRKASERKVRQFIKGDPKIGIIIPDNTRKAGVRIYLPYLLKLITSSGVNKSNIKILIASGSHKLMNGDELNTLLGKDIIDNYPVIQNDAFNKINYYYSGNTKRGTKVYLNKALQNADKIIATSSVLYHYFAGYGGGPKIVMPGMAFHETISSNHKMSLLKNGSFNPKCRNGNISDNPVYNDIIESIEPLREKILYLGTVLNDKGKIINAFCGDIINEHQKAANFINKLYNISIKEKADLVICSAGGSPKDINLIQSHKSIHNAYNAVKTGGTIVCLVECKAGIGSKTFLQYFTIKELKKLKEEIKNNYSLNAQTALAFRLKLDKCNIILITELTENILKNKHDNLQLVHPDKFEKILNKFSAETSYYVIPASNSININN